MGKFNKGKQGVKNLLLLSSMTLVLHVSGNAYAGIAPEVKPSKNKTSSLKKMVSKKCLDNLIISDDGNMSLPSGCNFSFSELYAHDQFFRDRVIKAFKASPFDGRFFDIESLAEITEPPGDNDDSWSVLLETVSKEKDIRAQVFAVPNINELTVIITDRGIGNKKCSYGVYGDIQERNESFSLASLYIKNYMGAFQGCKLLTKVPNLSGYDGLANQ
ncbi:hypothetical protein [Acinetobacter tianfuensis]|uniref:Uncharacterized protein n=1 Tax=Acinetobacter tianfuensis TaxID=2419603 RepID=A0A3A8EPF7_9GAMM|nr:hypothetical protein [Acinetobacter tianfuensis]RKG30741.1 hypothetical protein D7V32_10530 [Acinetobacter tianfuensis]